MSSIFRITLFHIHQLLRTPFFVQQAVTAPIVFALLRLFGTWGAETAISDDLWFDAALAGLWATTTTAVGIIGFQRFQGTLEHLAMSTLRPGVVFGTLCAAAALLGLVAIPISVGFQLVTVGNVGINLYQLGGLLGGVVACLASAFALASVFVLSRTATVYEPLILTPIWLLSGLVVPLSILPQWVSPILAIHPLTGAVLAARSATSAESLAWLGGSLLTSCAWSVLAAILLSAAMRRARVSGTLALS